jgi:hypothetical protein
MAGQQPGAINRKRERNRHLPTSEFNALLGNDGQRRCTLVAQFNDRTAVCGQREALQVGQLANDHHLGRSRRSGSSATRCNKRHNDSQH